MSDSELPTSAPDNDDEARDARLADVLDQLSRQAANGSSTSGVLEQLVRENPDLESDIRELHAITTIADDVAMFQSEELTRVLSGSETPPGLGFVAPDETAEGAEIGDYKLIEEIGRGGMGVVYRAQQKSLNRIVALKMIPNAAFASELDLARLRGEAQAAARLNHPNIIPVYDVGEYNKHPWFSMQLVKGSTLSQKLQAGPMSARDAVELLIPIVEAIGAAHKAGVLHRDIKPSNILISEAGEPFITDFGLSKRVPVPEESMEFSGSEDGLTLSGAILGTPSWMSPEQAAGDTESIDSCSDIYSLGAVLFAMLCGRPPFQAANPIDTMLMVMEQDPPAIRVLNSAIDADLEMVVLKCLQKPQDLRYSTAEELVEDLKAWRNHQPVSARRSTVVNVMTRLFRESHHVQILENWGLLWMWHSLVLLVLCLTTNAFQFSGMESRLPYVGLWVIGLGLWAIIFWNLRSRSGPITAVERQIAHVWAGSMLASSLLFWVEDLLGEPVLKFSPVLGLIAGIVFLVKAGMLSGIFYLHAFALFAGSVVMAAMDRGPEPSYGISLFGIISAATFFLPGLKYYRKSRLSRKRKAK